MSIKILAFLQRLKVLINVWIVSSCLYLCNKFCILYYDVTHEFTYHLGYSTVNYFVLYMFHSMFLKWQHNLQRKSLIFTTYNCSKLSLRRNSWIYIPLRAGLICCYIVQRKKIYYRLNFMRPPVIWLALTHYIYYYATAKFKTLILSFKSILHHTTQYENH